MSLDEAVHTACGDVRDKTVLDLGGYDGRQAAWALKRGAARAICVEANQWPAYLWGTPEQYAGVSYIHKDLHDWKEPADIVILQNVIYHCRNPWRMLEHVRTLTLERLVLTTSYIRLYGQHHDDAVWRVYAPGDGHPISWTVSWRPSERGLLVLLEATGFLPHIMWKENQIKEEQDGDHLVVIALPTNKPQGFAEPVPGAEMKL